MATASKASNRRRSRHGASSRLIEPLIVIVVVLILLLVAVPSYLGFKDRANSAAAQQNLREAIPAVEAYFALTNSSYVGLSLTWLKAFDPGLKLNDPAASPEKQTATSYCVSATIGGKTWYKAGPGGSMTTTAC